MGQGAERINSQLHEREACLRRLKLRKKKSRGKRNDEARGSPIEVCQGVWRRDQDGYALAEGYALVEECTEGGADDPIVVEESVGEEAGDTGRHAPG